MSLLSKTAPASILRPKPVPKLLSKSSGRGLFICLIGAPGVGKTSLLAQFKSTKFICDKRDQGILDLIDYSTATKVKVTHSDVDVCDSYIDMKASLELAVDEPDLQNIVVESLVGIQAFCDDYTMEEDYDSRINPKAKNNFVNYRNGLKISANSHFQDLIDIMLVGQNKGKNVWVTGHSKIGTAKSIDTDDWVSQVLCNDVEFSRRIDASFATILHIGVTTEVVKPGNKVRATGLTTGSIYTTPNPFFPGKNRMGLSYDIEYPDDCELAQKSLCAALKIDTIYGRRK